MKDGFYIQLPNEQISDPEWFSIACSVVEKLVSYKIKAMTVNDQIYVDLPNNSPSWSYMWQVVETMNKNYGHEFNFLYVESRK